MNQGDEHTKAMLRNLKEKGDIASQITPEIAKELVKTPPTTSLTTRSSDKERSRMADLEPALKTSGSAAISSLSTKELVAQLEQDSEAFNLALTDNTRLAKEQMQRSLLQLFEDTAREKLLDPNIVPRRGTATGLPPASPVGGLNSSLKESSSRSLASPLAGVMRPSKRPTDRGLDRRDAPSEVIIPDAVRDAIGTDIYTVVDHELKRFTGVIMTDLGRILEQVVAVRDRMSQLEEDLLQREVENRMQADQLSSSASLVNSLQDQVTELQQHNTTKDTQMDLLRDQIARRNASLDETRVMFRKEVMRYKQMVYDLTIELDTNTSSGKVHRRKLSLPDMLDEDGNQEIMAAAETAVKDVTEKFHEEIRQLQVKFAREKKAFAAEMNMKLSERDQEIMKLKAKLRAVEGKPDESS